MKRPLARRTRRPRLESLEARALLTATLTTDGLLDIEGTRNKDIIRIARSGAYVWVSEEEIGGRIGGSAETPFLASRITKIKVRGYEGNDKINFYGLDIAVEARGGPGNDSIYGGLMGDKIYGQAGDDVLYGNHGNDHISGGSGDDSLYGYIGNDTLYGGSGDDLLKGNDGFDSLYGNDGDDTLHGGAQNDLLKGHDGNDTLLGQDGNDTLYGGDHADSLSGGSGDDGLYGGGRTSKDTVRGGSGPDRFLMQETDIAVDVRSADARINFINYNSKWTNKEIEQVEAAFAVLQRRTGSTRLLRDTLKDAPMSFVKVKPYVKNGILLAGLNTPPAEPQSVRYWDWVRRTWVGYKNKRTYPRTIEIAEWKESSRSASLEARGTVFHEIGHNWDSARERSNVGLSSRYWTAFENLTGWKGVLRVPREQRSRYYLSGDKKWFYLRSKKNDFAYDKDGKLNTYGRHNPYEDWATTFEQYFQIYADYGMAGFSGGFTGEPVPNEIKLMQVEALMRQLS